MVTILRDKPDKIVLQRKDGSIVQVVEDSIQVRYRNMEMTIILHGILGFGERGGIEFDFPSWLARPRSRKKFDFKDMFRLNREIRKSPKDSPLRKLIYGETKVSVREA